MIQSRFRVRVASAQVNILFSEFIIVSVMSYYFNVMANASALFLHDLNPNVAQTPCSFQLAIQMYFIPQLLSERKFLTFLFDFGFQFDELLGCY